MSITMRKIIPLWILTIVGVLMIAEYFLPWPALNTAKGLATSWSVIIANFTVLLGVVYSVTFYSKKILTKKLEGDGLFAVFTVGMFVIFTITAFIWGTGSHEYQLLYLNINKPVASVVYAMCFFWTIGAAYRAFKLSSWDAGALTIAGLIFTIRNIPLGPMIFPFIVPMEQWMMNFLNNSARRGGALTASLGALIIAIRMLFQKERGLLGELQG